jgi:hypothetical protein
MRLRYVFVIAAQLFFLSLLAYSQPPGAPPYVTLTFSGMKFEPGSEVGISVKVGSPSNILNRIRWSNAQVFYMICGTPYDPDTFEYPEIFCNLDGRKQVFRTQGEAAPGIISGAVYTFTDKWRLPSASDFKFTEYFAVVYLTVDTPAGSIRFYGANPLLLRCKPTGRSTDLAKCAFYTKGAIALEKTATLVKPPPHP